MSSGWCYADVWETIADRVPDRLALVHGDRRHSWRDFEQRAAGVAATLLDAGAGHQDKVACYLYNGPEYLEVVFAAFKAGLVPVNTNYRYRDDELVYLWDNADAAAVAFHGCFAERIAGLRERLPKVRTWLWVDDGSGPCPAWALPYEQAATAAAGGSGTRWRLSGDDVLMIYTGGTTGLPKGVMWRQDDAYRAFNTQGDPPEPDLGVVARRATAGSGPMGLPASPLMHATGLMFSLTMLNQAGTVVALPSRHFDPPSCSTPCSVSRSRPWPSSATPSPARSSTSSTPPLAGGSSRASPWSCRLASCGAPRSRQAWLATCQGVCWWTCSARARPTAWAARWPAAKVAQRLPASGPALTPW